MIIRNGIVRGETVDIEVTKGLITGMVPATGGSHLGDVDASGQRVLPGFWDEHVHIRTWSQLLSRANLQPADDAAAVVEILRNHPNKGNEPIVGVGLRYALWKQEPKMSDLDAVSNKIPVIAFSMDLHSMWVNSVAAREYGMLEQAGETGILREHDCFEVSIRLAQIPDEEMDALIEAAAKKAKSQGIVGITSFEMEGLNDWERRVANGFDTIRVRASLYPERISEAFERGLKTGDRIAGPVEMGFLKVITDGAINTKTAYMHDPYDGFDTVGVLNTTETELERLVREVTDHGITAALHAIGDRANTVVIDTFERVGVSGRIEHAQMVLPEDVSRMAKLGLTASIQPTHAVDDREVADVLWGERVSYAYPMRSFLNAGVPVILGSDAPVATLDPWKTIRMATDRTDDNRPAWHPEEALTFDEAVACSARTTVEVGQPADLLLLSENGEVTPLW